VYAAPGRAVGIPSRAGNEGTLSIPLPWRGLYAIVDPAFCAGRDPLAVGSAILRGGCGVLQLRAKTGAPDAIEALARALLARCLDAQVAFVVNDDVDLAARIGAHGLHLGQADVTVAAARARLGPHVPIGLSTHSLAQASAALGLGADLIGFGPVFATSTKPDADPVVGLDLLAQVCATVALPVVAIGGVTAHNIGAVASAGARLAAAISALCGADDPERAARDMHRAVLAAA